MNPWLDLAIVGAVLGTSGWVVLRRLREALSPEARPMCASACGGCRTSSAPQALVQLGRGRAT